MGSLKCIINNTALSFCIRKPYASHGKMQGKEKKKFNMSIMLSILHLVIQNKITIPCQQEHE